jgi:hypothetical protein
MEKYIGSSQGPNWAIEPLIKGKFIPVTGREGP